MQLLLLINTRLAVKTKAKKNDQGQRSGQSAKWKENTWKMRTGLSKGGGPITQISPRYQSQATCLKKIKEKGKTDRKQNCCGCVSKCTEHKLYTMGKDTIWRVNISKNIYW